MGYPTKIATCCYCSSRTTLVLDRERHELACASCGAPLHNMKSLPRERRQEPKRERTYARPEKAARHKKKSRPAYGYENARPKHRKKRKGFMRHLFEEAFDLIEDIID